MAPESPHEHDPSRARARARVAILTVSDTRGPDSDESGTAIRERIESDGHTVTDRGWEPDDPDRVATRVRDWLAAEPPIEVIVTNGGTGLARRDTTIEAVDRFLERRIDGFGELFRMLSFREIGPAAMASRAVAGLAGSALIFALPGSPAAVRLALDGLIVPELPHLLEQIRGSGA